MLRLAVFVTRIPRIIHFFIFFNNLSAGRRNFRFPRMTRADPRLAGSGARAIARFAG